MSEHDEKLDRAYRALAKEEPPAALDAAILAASRRAVARPSLARRWAVPVSLAATLVLVVGVTLEMQREQPGVELSVPEKKGEIPLSQGSPEPAQTSTPAAPEASAPPAPQASPPVAPQAKPSLAPRAKRREGQALRDESDRAQGAAPPQAAAPMMARPAPETAKEAERFGARRAAGANAAAANPHDALEKIAKLRAEGRDEEADRALEEFRKRYPDYRIDDAMWVRVKPR